LAVAIGVVPMPGGDAAVKEPCGWRSGIAAADFDVESNRLVKLLGAQAGRCVCAAAWWAGNQSRDLEPGEAVRCGRAVVLNRRIVDYEAQAAIGWKGSLLMRRTGLEGSYVPELHTPEKAQKV